MESNVLSKSGFGIEIGQFYAEVPLLSHRKTSEIASFRKNRKNIKIFIFSLFFIDNYILGHFYSKLIEIIKKKNNKYIFFLIFSIFPRSCDFAGFAMRK
jgi:hypothetical protein